MEYLYSGKLCSCIKSCVVVNKNICKEVFYVYVFIEEFLRYIVKFKKMKVSI